MVFVPIVGVFSSVSNLFFLNLSFGKYYRNGIGFLSGAIYQDFLSGHHRPPKLFILSLSSKLLIN